MNSNLIVPFRKLCESFKNDPNMKPLLDFLAEAFSGVVSPEVQEKFDDLEDCIPDSSKIYDKIEECSDKIEILEKKVESLLR